MNHEERLKKVVAALRTIPDILEELSFADGIEDITFRHPLSGSSVADIISDALRGIDQD